MATIKKNTIKSKPKPYPNEMTRWAYYMQAIEPTSNKINEAWPEYHPLWVQHSQKITPSAIQFTHIRQYMLDMTIKQCAAYLRVTERDIKLWELDKRPVPFIAFELLRLVHESVHFRLSNKDWAGWFIGENGRLTCPNRGNLTFEPNDLTMVREVQNANRCYLMEYQKAAAKITALEAEVVSLKKANYEDELLTEMEDLQSKIKVLLNRMNEAKANQRKSQRKVRTHFHVTAE